MTGNEKIFLDMDTTVSSKVRLGNGSLVQAKGKGTISIETKKGKRYVHDVLFVPELEENLLSIDQLVENGYHLHFGDNACKIFYGKNQLIGLVNMEEKRRFPLKFHYGTMQALKVEVSQNSWL